MYDRVIKRNKVPNIIDPPTAAERQTKIMLQIIQL